MNSSPSHSSDITRRPKIGEVLIQQSSVNERQLESALSASNHRGVRVGQVLLEQQVISQKQLAEALARQAKMLYVDLNKQEIKPSYAQLISELLARKNGAVAIGPMGNHEFVVAMRDAVDVYAQGEVAKALRPKVDRVTFAFADEAAIASVHSRLYSKAEAMAELSEELRQGLTSGGQDQAPTDDTSVAARLVQTILDDAVSKRASDVHFEPMQGHLVVRMRIDGDLATLPHQDKSIARALVQRVKILANLDFSETRRPQDGAFSFRAASGKVFNVRLATAPSNFGETAVMRIIAAQGEVLGMHEIGFTAEDLETVMPVLEGSNGMILITGPTGSGKTTTLYSMLGHLNRQNVKIITVEDPIEATIDGVIQTQVSEKAGYQFSTALRTVLRQDPDVVLVGEVRDAETARMAMQSAQTGHLVLSTLHTNDAKSAPTRLVAMGVEPFMVASNVRLVMAQRLVKLTCPHCKAPEPVGAHQRAWLQRACPDLKGQSMMGKGCTHCLGTGWHGRQAIHEILRIDDELAGLLESSGAQDFLRAASSRLVGQTLAAKAARLAMGGLTTLVEAQKASGGQV